MSDLAYKDEMQDELLSRVEECMDDSNANHVIQKLVEVLHYDKLTFVVEVLERDIVKWATHTYGCRIIQKFIEYFPI